MMAEIQNTDLFLVNRNNTSYQVQAQNLMATIQETDLLLVNRGGVSYKVTGAEVTATFSPFPIKKPTITSPVANSTTLTNSVPVVATYNNAGDEAIHDHTDVEVALDSDTDFANPVYYLANITTKRAKGITLEPEKTFRVRMRFNTETAQGEWSDPVTFTTGKAFVHAAGEPFHGPELMFFQGASSFTASNPSSLTIAQGAVTASAVIDYSASTATKNERITAVHVNQVQNDLYCILTDQDKYYWTDCVNGQCTSAYSEYTLKQAEGLPEFWGTNVVQFTKPQQSYDYILLNNGELYWRRETDGTFALADTNVVKMSHAGGGLDSGAKGILYMKWVTEQNRYCLFIHHYGAGDNESQGYRGHDYINGVTIASGTQLTPKDGSGNEITDISNFSATVVPSQVYNICYFVQRESDNICYQYGLWHSVNAGSWLPYIIDDPRKSTIPHDQSDILDRKITRIVSNSGIGGQAQTWYLSWILKDFKAYQDTNTSSSYSMGLPSKFSSATFRSYSQSAATYLSAYDPVFSTSGFIYNGGYKASTKRVTGRRPKITNVSIVYNGCIFAGSSTYGNGRRQDWNVPCFNLNNCDDHIGTKVMWYQ